MVNSQGTVQNGPPNGGYMQPQAAEQRPMARPFTLSEALPYSPQTSVIPFTSGWWLSLFVFDIARLIDLV